jgi:hypothetical protein
MSSAWQANGKIVIVECDITAKIARIKIMKGKAARRGEAVLRRDSHHVRGHAGWSPGRPLWVSGSNYV